MVTGKFVKVFCFSVECRLPELVIVFLLLSNNVVRNSAFHYNMKYKIKLTICPSVLVVCFFFLLFSSKEITYTHTTLCTTDYKYEA